MASTHAEARAAAERARDALKRRDDAKAAVAVDRQTDRFAETARRAKAEGWSRTGGPRHTKDE
jgi:hypothetical protein